MKINEEFLKKELDCPLNDYFKKYNYSTSWDFDKEYKWIEIPINNKGKIIQIEYEASIDQFIDIMVKHIILMEKGIDFEPDFFIASNATDEEIKVFALTFDEVKEKIK